MSLRSQPVPQPSTLPLFGNLHHLELGTPVQSFMKLARKFGPVYRITLPGAGDALIVSGFDLVDELCDTKRFDKLVAPAIYNLREFVGDGLFTAHTNEPNWGKAHRILTPAFNGISMRDYFPAMVEVALQLVGKWEKKGDADIDVSDDMTRYTLDTVALCGFGYRFNSFGRGEMHPFVNAMLRALREALDRINRLPIQTRLLFGKRWQFSQDIAFMNKTVDQVINERRAAGNGPERGVKPDLLSLMMSGVDRSSGEGLSDVNIRQQIITFLIAGHETTSGMLSFALYYLLKDPSIRAKAREESERVLGERPGRVPTFEDLAKLTYVSAVSKEALRLWPTAPMWAVTPLEETTLGGKIRVQPGDNLMVLLPSLHRDPKVWGPNPEHFDPENFSAAAVQSRPPNAYRPFGNGQRGCIGRHFAMQEAVLALSLILDRFEIGERGDYQLKVKETLSLKPEALKLYVTRRTDRPGELSSYAV